MVIVLACILLIAVGAWVGLKFIRSTFPGVNPILAGLTRESTPRVIYMAPSQSPELWIQSLDGSEPRRLTETGGRIYDYAVSKSGDQIVYSAQNEQGGFSLWSIHPAGQKPRLLMDCSEDWCVMPDISPDGKRLAYVRKMAGVVEGSSPGLPRIWLLELRDLSTRQLHPNANLTGYEPVFSPDGEWLAFQDAREEKLRLVEIDTAQVQSLSSAVGMSATWSPAGLVLYYNQIVVEETAAYGRLYRYDVISREITPVFAEDGVLMNEGRAALSPDGEWLVVARNEINGNLTRDLWLMRLDGSQSRQISDDPSESIGTYAWSPDSKALVYQALPVWSSGSSPMLKLWTRETNSTQLIAQDAIFPKWLP